MTERVDLYESYSNFTEHVLAAIREETFGKDIGQNSWLTTDEYDRFISWLRLEPGQHVLEVASGSGGPSRYLALQTDCFVTGIDANESGVETTTQALTETDLKDRVTFKVADANGRLPFV
ncbi:MAG TPA: methyltransferase domain-containing protein, partial [Pyrinomonadaceae bacterium]|nr:methyltransferase domain-containing protein [Pyrinomonadaceae bacterium]